MRENFPVILTSPIPFAARFVVFVLPLSSATILTNSAPPHLPPSVRPQALAGRIPLAKLSGEILYNGKNQRELNGAKGSARLKLLSTYVDQMDVHLPFLTVRETLTFAYENNTACSSSARSTPNPLLTFLWSQSSLCLPDRGKAPQQLLWQKSLATAAELCSASPAFSADSRCVFPSSFPSTFFPAPAQVRPELLGNEMLGAEASHRVDRVLKVLSLTTCADTLVGNEMARSPPPFSSPTYHPPLLPPPPPRHHSLFSHHVIS